MKWSELRNAPDATTRALVVLSDRWTLILLSQCLAGLTRFDDLQRTHGLSRSIVSDRLKLLIDEGILERHPYNGVRHEYRLTAKGEALSPLLEAIRLWAETHDSGTSRPKP
ncbi:MAG: helix-turn-helix domain-containing protein [Phenylobacterium sp.]|uniref:winged helix-turn-helix transcriptional regulator n=1 Tax=Phenylobacterium sp. TaxID=1871053 RepID=UPI0027332664|nr:helix-turn-helix domain-containing protein [Phenylobacterium sp.]MDP3749132.1 helix-turn-helix domain-containing protein [Phenylobacterium sp.]